MGQANTDKFIHDWLAQKLVNRILGSARKRLTPHWEVFPEDICEGQIRLLSQTEEGVRVLVVHTWGDDAHIIVPLSDFDSPATDEEIKVGNVVAQVWGGSSLQDKHLCKSWVMGKLTEKQTSAVFNLWAHFIDGRKLEPHTTKFTGAPISEQTDGVIREICEYMDEYFDKMSKIHALDLEDL